MQCDQASHSATATTENPVSSVPLKVVGKSSIKVATDEIRLDSASPPTANVGAAEVGYITGFKLLTVMATVTLTCFTMMLDTSIVATAVPKITSDFHSLSDVGWYGSSYLISNCALQPLTGKLYAQFSSKWTLMVFIALFELGSLICGVSVSSTMLIIGRSVAGLGASGLTNGSLTIISACVPIEKRAFYLGTLLSFAQIGTLLGPVIGGALTTYTSWRWCFYINLPIGSCVALILSIISIPERFVSKEVKSKRAALHSLDLVGFCLFAPTAISFLLALEWGETAYPLGNARIIALFCLSAVLLALFLVWEHRRGSTAMIPLSILKGRVVYSRCILSFCIFGGLMISSYYLPIYFQAVKGVSAVRSGVNTLPGVLPQMISAAVSGYLVGKLGYYLPFAIVLGVMTSVAYGLLSTLSPTTTTANWVGYQIMAGIGRGCGIQIPLIAVQTFLPPAMLPVAMSLLVFCQNLGGAVALAVAQTAFSSELASSLHNYDAGIDVAAITAAGASGFRAVVSDQEELVAVVKAYAHGVDTVFYIAAGMGVVTLCACAGIGWKDIRAKKTADPV